MVWVKVVLAKVLQHSGVSRFKDGRKNLRSSVAAVVSFVVCGVFMLTLVSNGFSAGWNRHSYSSCFGPHASCSVWAQQDRVNLAQSSHTRISLNQEAD